MLTAFRDLVADLLSFIANFFGVFYRFFDSLSQAARNVTIHNENPPSMLLPKDGNLPTHFNCRAALTKEYEL